MLRGENSKAEEAADQQEIVDKTVETENVPFTTGNVGINVTNIETENVSSFNNPKEVRITENVNEEFDNFIIPEIDVTEEVNDNVESNTLENGNIPQLDGTICPAVKRISFYKDGVPAEFAGTFEINPNWDPSKMWYQCEQCEYHASTAGGLWKHKKKKHNISNPYKM